MEFKKKTIIWEDNNEPPKDYIGVKSDGKAYEYSYSQRKGIESKSISSSGSGNSCSCLPPMIVSGTLNLGGMFFPNSGSPTFEEAQAHMRNGGLVYFLVPATQDGGYDINVLASYCDGDVIWSPTYNEQLVWAKPTFVNGRIIPHEGDELVQYEFIPNEGEMTWSEAYNAWDNGNFITLVYLNGDGVEVADPIANYSNDLHVFLTDNHVVGWYRGIA